MATLAALSNLPAEAELLPAEARAELEARELEADTEVARLLLEVIDRKSVV